MTQLDDRLDRLQFAKEAVVFGVGDRRRVEHVVVVSVADEQRAQLGGSGRQRDRRLRGKRG